MKKTFSSLSTFKQDKTVREKPCNYKAVHEKSWRKGRENKMRHGEGEERLRTTE